MKTANEIVREVEEDYKKTYGERWRKYMAEEGGHEIKSRHWCDYMDKKDREREERKIKVLRVVKTFVVYFACVLVAYVIIFCLLVD